MSSPKRFNSYQDLKPGMLVLVKYGRSLWPSFTMHADYLTEDVIQEKLKLKSTAGPVPVIFFGDHSWTWTSLDSISQVTDEEIIANLPKVKKNKYLYKSYKEAVEFIEDEKNGISKYEKFIRNLNFIDPDEDFEEPEDFGKWIETMSDRYGMNVTKPIKNLQLRDLELLADKNLAIEEPQAESKKETTSKGVTKKRPMPEEKEDCSDGHDEEEDKPNPHKKSRLAIENKVSNGSASDKQAQRTPKLSATDRKEEPEKTLVVKKPTATKSGTPVKDINQPPQPTNKEHIKLLEPQDTFNGLDEDDLETICVIYRASLQRALIQRDSVPSLIEYANASVKLEDLEKFNEEGHMKTRFLKASKIHKVLKAMLRLDYKQPEPVEGLSSDISKFRFKERADTLLTAWEPFIQKIVDEKKKQGQDMIPVYEALNKNGTLRNTNKTRKSVAMKGSKDMKTTETQASTEDSKSGEDLSNDSKAEAEKTSEMKDVDEEVTEESKNVEIQDVYKEVDGVKKEEPSEVNGISKEEYLAEKEPKKEEPQGKLINLEANPAESKEEAKVECKPEESNAETH